MNLFKRSIVIATWLPLVAVWSTGAVAKDDVAAGKAVYDKACFACHKSGVMGAPKLASKDDWAPRVKQGKSSVLDHALNGLNSMPARGGNPTLSDADIGNAVAYMVKEAGLSFGSAAPAKAAAAKPAAKKVAEAPKPAAKSAVPVPVPAAATVAKKPKISFNRLMPSSDSWNPPPAEDGIHDPDNEGTFLLQAPREGMAGFAKGVGGNRVDWVKTLADGTIEPRYDRVDPNKRPFVMDLDIVREVKGSMPDVVYPHKQHTEWLDCSNCHPDIFIPKKGANQISMAAILLGQKCGVCHGKVAFPVTECKRCHSKKKKAVGFKE
ncbi:MAG: c(7)-type cytochrome triheme domain-containing protein [Halopseudomonas sp.]